jgi:hypothetical protein
MVREMERLGFTRLDSALRHIILNNNKELKLIDIVHSYVKKEPRPARLFGDLEKLGLVRDFMEKVKQIDIDLYNRWEQEMRKYIKN